VGAKKAPAADLGGWRVASPSGRMCSLLAGGGFAQNVQTNKSDVIGSGLPASSATAGVAPSETQGFR